MRQDPIGTFNLFQKTTRLPICAFRLICIEAGWHYPFHLL